MSPMDFSLSPPPSTADVQTKLTFKVNEDELKRAEQVLLDHVKRVSDYYRKTGEKLDYLSLDHPAVKKTNQKHEQRRKHRRSAYYVGMRRAQKWLKLWQAEKDTRRRNEYHSLGFDGRVSGPKSSQFQRHSASWMPVSAKVMVKNGLAFEAKEVLTVNVLRTAKNKPRSEGAVHRQGLLFEEQLLKVKNSSLTTPVPEPTPLELSRSQVTRKVGNAAHVKTNFCDKCGEYVYQNHEHPKEQAATV